jgi:uncharacterized membrane protein
MNNKIIYKIIAVISVICLICSVVIHLENASYSLHQNSICSAITGTNGCEVVQTSSYGKTFGISNSWYGIVGFTLLSALSILMLVNKYNKNILIKYLMITGGIIAGAVALVLLYLQAFILHTYCVFCLVVDISSLVIFGLAIYLLIKIGRHK